jgi:hypothetical protein
VSLYRGVPAYESIFYWWYDERMYWNEESTTASSFQLAIDTYTLKQNICRLKYRYSCSSIPFRNNHSE